MPLLARLALVAALSVAIVAPAHATTVAPLTLDQMTDASDLVVRGTVDSTWVDEDEKGFIWTRALVRIDETMKGAADVGDYVTVESAGGTFGDRFADVSGAARYSVGEEAVLFLSDKPAKSVYGTVGMSLGKYTIRPAPLDGTPLVVRFAPSYSKPYDARFIPVPPADKRVTLDTMERLVRARVDLGWDGQPIPGISAERLRTINRIQPGVR
jgi:hypothetical protein